jgi:transcriptional regulator with XRE-family HTH domain
MSNDSYKPVKQVQKDHEALLKSIGESIEDIRKQKGISVTELCNRVGMSRTTYYRMRDGIIYFNTEKLFLTLDVLETDISVSFRERAQGKS